MLLIRGRFGYCVRQWRYVRFPGRVEYSHRHLSLTRLGNGKPGNVLLRNWRYTTRGLTGYQAPGSKRVCKPSR